jgi:hypothetical protein
LNLSGAKGSGLITLRFNRSGRLPKWPTGADCKSAGLRLRWFESITYHHSFFIRKMLILISIINSFIQTSIFDSVRFLAFGVFCVLFQSDGYKSITSQSCHWKQTGRGNKRGAKSDS